MHVTLLLPTIIVLATFVAAASQDISIAKPDCMDRCGNVSIPFPFGTNGRCYHSYSFWVTCNESYLNPPRLFWQDSTVEIKSILLSGQMRVMQFVAYDCEPMLGSPGPNVSHWSNAGSPNISLPSNFTVSTTENKFTVVGCDAYGIVSGERPGRNYSTGCTATCTLVGDLEKDSCNGSGCCQVSIPTDALSVAIEVGRRNKDGTVREFSMCTYGFLVEANEFRFSRETLTSLKEVETLPLVVDWAIGNGSCEEAEKSLSDYACRSGNSRCYKPDTGYGYRCSCNDGYLGNPYLVNGCHDINECLQKKCQHQCINTAGGFHCRCRRGYHGNGRVDGEGCMRDELFVVKIVIGIASGIIFLLVVAWLASVLINRRRLRRLMHKYFVQNGGVKFQEQLRNHSHSPDISVRIFSESELVKATNGFHSSAVVGQGAFGRVYRGTLSDNTEVAIKKPRGFDEKQVDQFITEAIILSQINHKHAVKLLGCCFETDTPLLVYEFITNGDLASFIHDHKKAPLLSWDLRLKIASESAQVLSYLHSATSHPIIHRDIKSDNILLDSTFTTKVSDFGASRLVPDNQTPHSTAVLGTRGYVDPEYRKTRRLTTKSDVYGFGVVLLELLTGKRPIIEVGGKEENLVEHFLSIMQQAADAGSHSSAFQLVDAQIVTKGNEKEITIVAELAQWCLKPKGEDRPSMKDIEQELEKLRIERKSSLVKTEES